MSEINNWQEAKANKERINYSSWLITVNSNVPILSPDQPEFKPTKEKLQEVYDKITNNVMDYIKFTREDRGEEFIWSIDGDGAIEIGPSRGMLHIHFYIAIRHFTKLKLDYSKLGNDIKVILPNGHFQPKFFRNSAAYVKQYVHKRSEELGL